MLIVILIACSLPASLQKPTNHHYHHTAISNTFNCIQQRGSVAINIMIISSVCRDYFDFLSFSFLMFFFSPAPATISNYNH